MSTFFTQPCPTCGRQLRIHSNHAKQVVACRHCRAEFLPRDPQGTAFPQEDWRTSLMKRVDKVLAMAAGVA